MLTSIWSFNRPPGHVSVQLNLSRFEYYMVLRIHRMTLPVLSNRYDI